MDPVGVTEDKISLNLWRLTLYHVYVKRVFKLFNDEYATNLDEVLLWKQWKNIS